MGEYRTLEALQVVGALAQYLRGTKADNERTAKMVSEFENMVEFEPEGESGIFAVVALEPEDETPTQGLDRYATRRGSAHWTRRRPTQGPTRKLSDEGALDMRLGYFNRLERVAVLAARWNVTPSTVYGVLNGKTHRRPEAGWHGDGMARPGAAYEAREVE